MSAHTTPTARPPPRSPWRWSARSETGAAISNLTGVGPIQIEDWAGVGSWWGTGTEPAQSESIVATDPKPLTPARCSPLAIMTPSSPRHHQRAIISAPVPRHISVSSRHHAARVALHTPSEDARRTRDVNAAAAAAVLQRDADDCLPAPAGHHKKGSGVSTKAHPLSGVPGPTSNVQCPTGE